MGATKTPKEKVLHTRVPEALEAQIKALADALRVPVSSLVRNILQDSVTVIDTAAQGLEEELRKGWTEFQTIMSENFRARSNGSSPASAPEDHEAKADAKAMFPDVLGWQALTLNLDASCSRCERALPAGDVAHLGVRERPGPRVLICAACLPQNERKE